MLRIALTPLAILLSLSTGFGVFLHETKVDKLAALTIAAPLTATKKTVTASLLDSMPHTHHSHADAGFLGMNSREFRTKSPGLMPRRDKDERYRLNKKVARGFHFFDSYHLPLSVIT
jgi:hypothetical protein